MIRRLVISSQNFFAEVELASSCSALVIAFEVQGLTKVHWRIEYYCFARLTWALETSLPGPFSQMKRSADEIE
jgi:hypothetical protein